MGNKEFVSGRSAVADHLLESMRARTESFTETVFGLDMQVDPGVYPPEQREITVLYLEDTGAHLLGAGVKVLDFGCGSGFLAVYAAKKGAEVTAIDINSRAVACTLENVDLHDVGDQVAVFESDGFADVPEELKFDLILASIPWEAAPVGNPHDLDVSFYDPGFRTRLGLFDDACDRLTPEGRILLSWSKRVERINPMAAFSDQFDFEIVYKAPSTDGNEEEYLYSATRKKGSG